MTPLRNLISVVSITDSRGNIVARLGQLDCGHYLVGSPGKDQTDAFCTACENEQNMGYHRKVTRRHRMED